jgi:DNA invertase Pin-like site-specific DNA recombinase
VRRTLELPESSEDTSLPALVYCRVSTRRGAASTSLESQRALCSAHAERLGYAVARVTQEVFSGAELFGRPKLSRDRADIRSGLFRALVAYSVDRLTRNEAHLAIITAECERAGCRVIFVTEESGAGRADEAYAAGVERSKVVERMHRGRRFHLSQGRPAFTGWDLYGYRRDKEAAAYRVHEPEAAVVRRIFETYASGVGMHRITAAFIREGLPSPKSGMRPGARWSTGAVSDILNNRSYMGEEYTCKMKTGPGRRNLPLPESEWVRLPDGVRPAIVSKELWEACRRVVRTRSAKLNNKGRRPALLRGHIFCAECGAGMVRNYFKRGKYEYLKYRCGSRWRPFATECRGAGVPLELVEEWAWARVESVLDDPSALGSSVLPSPDPLLLADLEAARLAHERAEQELLALRPRLLARADGPALHSVFERALAQAEREKQQMEGAIAEIEKRIDEALRPASELSRLRELSGLAREALSFDERRLALRALGVKVYANGDEPTHWRYEIGLAVEGGI